jgi:hypothetical protein
MDSMGGPSSGGVFVAHTLKSLPLTPPLPPLIGRRVARAVKGSDQCRGMDGMGSSLSFSGGPSAGGTLVTHTPKSSPSMPPLPSLIGGWAVRTVKGSGWCGGMDGMRSSLSFSRGPSAGGALVAHTPKSLPLTPPLPSLIGGWAVRMVEGSGWCGGMDGRTACGGRPHLFQGWVLGLGRRGHKGVRLKYCIVHIGHNLNGRVWAGMGVGRRGTFSVTRTRTRENPNPRTRTGYPDPH